MNETRKPVLTGGCQCGAVRYALYRTPANPHICHCRMCQKAVGGPFAAYAAIMERDFAWTRGEPASFESSTIVTRGFCRDCGTPLLFRFAGDRWLGFTLASLDDPEQVVPTQAVGLESRLSWFEGLHDLPHSRADEELTPERAAAMASHQHPDHDTDTWLLR